MTADAQWQVESLPPQPEPGAAPGPAAGDGATPPPEVTAGGGEWTDADVKALLDLFRGAYDKIAEVTEDPAYKLSKVDELMLVGTFSTWLPVSWIRSGAHGQLPLAVAIPLTVGALIAVNLPRLLRWNLTHPEAAVPIPFMPKGVKLVNRNAGGPARPSGAAPSAGSGGEQPERPGGAGDRGEDQQPQPEPEARPAPAGEFPVGDSIDDVQRSYGS